jgi:Mn-containing catalase
MFTRHAQLQYTVRVDKPDPIYARQLQELIGGKYGEMSVMMQYLFQGWALRGDQSDARLARIKDMLLDTGTEEIAHVEMLATCIAMLLDGASPAQQEEAATRDPVVYAALGGMNPQHLIVTGLGALPADSNGVPWTGAYATASGNVVPDLYSNATAEMNGRLQATRMYEMTSDSGVRDMLHFMIARDHMHQIQWLAAIEELGGPTAVLPTPADFPLAQEMGEYALSFMAYAQDPSTTRSGDGRWAKGSSIDGKGEFTYIAEPFAVGEQPHLQPAPATLHSAPPPDGAAKRGGMAAANVATIKESGSDEVIIKESAILIDDTKEQGARH